MKRLAALLAFLVAGVAAAQEGTYADSKANFSVSKDGGLVVPVGYLTIKDETTALAQEGILTFLGAGVTCVDNAGNTATECTIPGGSSNALLDGTNHTDTLAGTVARGDVIIGNSTPKWARLAKGSAGNQLFTDGTDVSWSSPNLLSTSHGDTLAGSVTRGAWISGNSTPKWQTNTVPAQGTYLGSVDGVDLTASDPFLDMNRLIIADEEFGNPTKTQTITSGSGAIANVGSGGAGHDTTRIYSTGAAVGMEGGVYFNTSVATVAGVLPGTGQIIIKGNFKISSVGDATDVVKYTFGLCDKTATGTECTNGIYLLYDRAQSTTNWMICTANGGVYTRTDTTISASAGVGSFHTYTITVNAAGNSVTCQIDATPCAAHAGGNFPTTSSAMMFKNDKTAGTTTTFNMEMDVVKAVKYLTAGTR